MFVGVGASRVRKLFGEVYVCVLCVCMCVYCIPSNLVIKLVYLVLNVVHPLIKSRLSAHFVLGACFVVAKCHKHPSLMCLYNYVVFV